MFADDTYLALSDKNLSQLEHELNYQLKLIDQWLKRNKFTLNCLFNNQPHLPVCSNFRLCINKSQLKRGDAVKYLGLGLCIDN